MKRPWFFWGLIMYLTCFSKILGMELVFIPLLVAIFLIFPDKKRFLAILVLILLRLYISSPLPSQEQGQWRVRQLSITGQDRIVSRGTSKYLLRAGELEEGIYKGSFKLEPFSKKRSPSGFCEEDYYRSLGLRARATEWEGELLAKKAHPLSRMRAYLYEKSSVFGDYQGLAFSLSFGLKEGLSYDERELFSSLGLMHLFVVSGLHLGIYFRGLIGLTNFFSLPRFLGEIVGFIAIVFFSFLSDFHVSTLRSLILLFLTSLGFHTKRKLDPIEGLGFAVFLLLAYRPYYATSFSFILGTLSYGIIRISREKKILKLYALMLPLQLLFISQIKLVYYLVNGILASLMSYILPLLVLGYINKLLRSLVVYIFVAMMKLLELTKELPWYWHIRPPGWFFLIVFYLALLVVLASREKKHLYKLLGDRRVLALIFLILLSVYSWENNYRTRGVHFLDVGQGDSSLIVTPKGTSILIDTGRGRAIHEHLDSLGISHLDYVFISHFDEDHSMELKNLSFDKLYYPKGSTYPSGLPLEKGDIIQVDGVRLEALAPDKLFYDSNEDSLVLLVDYLDRRMLFTGDIGVKGIETLARPRVDILHYPHHGSKYSLDRDYYRGLDPAMVILSYGRNRYGHPHEEVIDFLEDRFDNFETGKSGTLHLKSRGYRSY